MLDLSEQYYKQNKLLEVIKCYETMIQHSPKAQTIHHNLACFYNVQAQSAKLVKNEQEYNVKLIQAQQHFQQALALQSNSGICTEFGNFLYLNNIRRDAISCLREAIGFKDGRKLSYSLMEKSTVPQIIQQEIDKLNIVTIQATNFAYYLLILIYLETNQRFEADKLLHEFEQILKLKPEPLAQHLLAEAHQLKLTIVPAMIDVPSAAQQINSHAPSLLFQSPTVTSITSEIMAVRLDVSPNALDPAQRSDRVPIVSTFQASFWHARCDFSAHASWTGTRFEHKEQAEAELVSSAHAAHSGLTGGRVTPTI